MSPLRSKRQRRFLWAKKPGVARRFENHTSKSQKRRLPEKKKRKMSRKRRR